MAKLFNTVGARRPKKTAFDLSHEKKLSMKIGQLIPILNEPVVPGDKWNISSEVFIRLAPMLAPVMHRMNAYIHYFFVPNRIIWDDWESFITGNPEKLILPPWDASSVTDIRNGSLTDYLGLPTNKELAVMRGLGMHNLPYRAYQKIWNDYYRDQNLQAEVDITVRNEYIQLRTRAWEKDYFTSALPFSQKGAPAQLPFTNNWTYKQEAQALTPDPVGPTNVELDNEEYFEAGGQRFGIDNIENIFGTIDINDFRTAHRLQRWLERQARAGSRYVETILSHFGERLPDYTAQRPVYLGGGKTPIVISQVLNTNGNQASEQGATNRNLGGMAGHGIAVGNTNRAVRKFNEYGYLFGILSVIPKTAYEQGVHKEWIREEYSDFYWPEFANLGEQAVLNKELIVADDDSVHDNVFGYQSRYSEYKYKNSSVHGDFRDTLRFWHMGRKFDPANEPALNEDFIKCDASEVDHIFAVPTQPEEPIPDDHLWTHIYHKIKAVRPMPYYGTPTI